MSNITVIYEHQDWLLCHKPHRVDFHDDGDTPGFMSQISEQQGTHLLPVHRLDKPTSGLILVAKTKEACSQLCELFANRNIQKFYLAVCPASLKKKQGKISGDMAKARRGAFKLLKTLENPAVTQFFSHSIADGMRLCLLKPKTGKTHQLRVALKSLGAAILGDALYGAKEADRLYLHAYALKFTYDGKDYEFINKPDSGPLFLKQACLDHLETWQQPWSLNWPK